ncbi:MAG: ATP-binding cassette domain-containing protein [Alphaproteobacteria bacterium]|nr:ATP-binding cassette domain-containing protein [Alphaproteobacteria bacterium]
MTSPTPIPPSPPLSPTPSPREFRGNAHDPLPPAPEGGVWLLREGGTDVFVVSGDAGHAPVVEGHLFSLDSIGVILPDALDDVRLVAVPLMNSRLEVVAREALDADAWEHELVPWLEAVGRGLRRAGLGWPEFSLFLDDEEGDAAPGAATFSVRAPLLWAVAAGHPLRPFGGSPPSDDPLPVPMTKHSWCVAPERAWCVSPEREGRPQAASTSDILKQGTLWAGLSSFNRTVLSLAHELLSRRRRRNESRLAGRQSKEHEYQGHLMDAAVESIDTRRLPKDSNATRDPLALACRKVARWHGMKIKVDAVEDEEMSVHDRIYRIAGGARFQVRKILLSEDWWKEDTGALLGFDQSTGAPVALIPGARNRLYRHDFPESKPRLVNAETAGTVAPHAYTFYRSLPENAKTLKDVLNFVLPTDKSVLSIVLMSLAISLLALLPPLMIKVLFATAIPSNDYLLIVNVAVSLVVIHATSILVQITYETTLARLEGKAAAKLQAALFDRVLRLPSAFVQKIFLGKIHSKWMLFEKLHGGAFLRFFVPAMLTGGFSVFSLLLMFSFFPLPAWVVLVLTLLVLIYAVKVGKWQLAGMGMGPPMPGHYWSVVTEILGAIGKIRLAGAEDRAFNRWFALLIERRVRYLQGLRHRSRFKVVMSMYEGSVLLLILIMLASQYDSHALPMGPFMAFLAAGKTFTTAVTLFATTLPDLRLALEDDLPDVLPFLAGNVENPLGDEPHVVLQGRVELSKLTFGYPGSAKPVLQGLSLEARPGEFIALVGRSGCGKSTLMKLLLGMEKPSSGGIFYDGQDLASMDMMNVRSQIGVVMQSADLIPGTIFDYITASRHSSLEDAWAIAKLAGVDDVIRNLPMGMFTFISEGSSALSGGQMQRLMIARALGGRPKLLFFDEATSWLDNKTQKHIVDTLSRLQITRVIIAHRLSTVRNADRIYVLDDGVVAAEGTFEELMRENGLFADLAYRQLT